MQHPKCCTKNWTVFKLDPTSSNMSQHQWPIWLSTADCHAGGRDFNSGRTNTQGCCLCNYIRKWLWLFTRANLEEMFTGAEIFQHVEYSATKPRVNIGAQNSTAHWGNLLTPTGEADSGVFFFFFFFKSPVSLNDS